MAASDASRPWKVRIGGVNSAWLCSDATRRACCLTLVLIFAWGAAALATTRVPTNAGVFGKAIDLFLAAADDAEMGNLAEAQRALARMQGSLDEMDNLTASGTNLTFRSPDGAAIAAGSLRSEALAHRWGRESNV